MPKPAPLESYTDPAFGTKITRITAAPSGTARRTLYNTIQPWSADERYLMLYHTGDTDAGHHLYDGRNYRYLEAMPFAASDIEGIYWDNADSASLYFVQERPKADELYGKLVKYDINTRQRSLVADLTPVCGDAGDNGGRLAIGGNDIQGMQGNLIGLRCQKNNADDSSFTVNVKTGQISNSVNLNPVTPQGNHAYGFRPDVSASPLPSGRQVLVQDAVFDSSMNYLYQIDASKDSYRMEDGRSYEVPKLEHSSVGRMPNGNDALFTPSFDVPKNGCDADSDFGVGALIAYDLTERSCNVIVGPSTGWDFPLRTVHVSALSKKKPGWVTMTTVGNGKLEYLSNNRAAPVFMSELSMTYADPTNPTTCRLAHVRTHGKEASRGDSYRGGYFGEPHAVMSPSGTRIVFNSDWHDSGSVDAYVADLSGPGPTSGNLPDPEAPPESDAGMGGQCSIR